MKKWLNQCNEEGISNGDAVYVIICTCIAIITLVILCKFFR